VLHLITRWLRGGAEEKTFAELVGLSGGYRFALAHGASYDIDMAARVDALGMPRRIVPELRHLDLLRAPGAIRAIRRVVQDIGPNILHVHSTEAGILGRQAARGLGIPVVYTLHGLPFSGGRSWPMRAAIVIAEQAVAGVTERYLANSGAIRDAYLRARIGRASQYVVVPSGIDLASVASAPPVATLPGARPRVLFAGRLEPGKGLQRLIRAVATLRGEGVALDLLVAGEGPLLKEIPKWAHALGYRTDLSSVIKACDIVALPSSVEGTPRVLTEAMACGVPIVASAVGGIPEQVGDAGLLVAPDDATALVSALRLLSTDEGARDLLAKRGPERAARFSRDAMLAATSRVYDEILEV
jgi:glycosyltransferase involved in cell wall biosynthesis